ncbi:MAG: DMT family transporter [Eubacterium sp.]|nr:DMT family transporter [Eubacterium sp.]
MDNKKQMTGLNSFLLVVTALIWGCAFVAQSTGGDVIGAYAFCCLRYLIGGAVLIPVIKILDKTKLTSKKPESKDEKKTLLAGGACCGACLAVASMLQQVGINSGTPVGKAGFLTACYIVLVPILGIFLKKKCGINVWLAVAITVGGLYLLCINGKLTIQKSDLLVMACALIFACHILTIDHFLEKGVHPVRMACLQFFAASVISFFPMFFYELHMNPEALLKMLSLAFGNKQALISLLYAGVMSSGVAYTLQIVGQKGVNPTVASLIMSLESVFSVLAGWVILHQTLTFREIIGCALIFAAVVLAQIPVKQKIIKNPE